MTLAAKAGQIALAYVRARRRQTWHRAEIERHQRNGLQSALGRSTPGDGLREALDTLDVTDASEVRQQFAAHNRLGFSIGEARSFAEAEKAGTFRHADGYSFGLSTGTDGPPGVFITSAEERARYIGTILGKLLSLRALAGCRIALLLRHDNRLYSETSQTRLIRIEHYDIARPVADWARRLCASAPDVIIGPPSVLLEVTRTPAFARRPLTPAILLAGAEPLFPSDALRLVSAFGVTPRPIYQTCEGFIAVACRKGVLHVNEDVLIAEWQRFRASPQRALPVITDFSRTTQSFWRVRLADVVAMRAEPCPCGSSYRALAGVEGRLGDVLISDPRRGDGVQPIFPFDLDRALSGHFAEDCEWQLRQTQSDALAVTTSRPLTAQERSATAEALAHLGGWTNLSWEPLAPRRAEIKRRRFVRLFDPQSRLLAPLLGPPSL